MYLEQLRNTLSTLPIAVGKVHLWLVYRDLKPMTTIVMDTKNPHSKQQLDSWLNKSALVSMPSKQSPNTFHISKDQSILDQYQQVELSTDKNAHTLRGALYGFPPPAVAVFPSDQLILPLLAPVLEDKYWLPYIEYLVRRGYEVEDSMMAKTWADLARAEIPEVAAGYEQSQFEAIAKFRSREV